MPLPNSSVSSPSSTAIPTGLEDPIEHLNPVILVSAGFDHTIRFWEALSGNCSRILQFTESHILALCISRDKRILGAAGNPFVKLYDLSVGGQDPFMSLEAHTSNVTSIGFPIDARWFYTSGEDGFLKIWDSRISKCQREWCNDRPGEHKPLSINHATLHPNQAEIFAGDNQGNIICWDLSMNKISRQWKAFPSSSFAPLSSISISPDGNTLAAGNLVLCDLESTEKEDLRIQAHDQYALRCLFSPDGSCIATTSADKTIKIWSSSDLTLKSTLKGHDKWVWDCSFSADSAYLLSASSDKTAKLWDLKNQDLVRSYLGHDLAVTAIALNDFSL